VTCPLYEHFLIDAVIVFGTMADANGNIRGASNRPVYQMAISLENVLAGAVEHRSLAANIKIKRSRHEESEWCDKR
jgi:hypothetical protein